MSKFSKLYKIIFYFLNFFIIVLSIYPGSFLGCFVFNNCNYDPQITKDFIISSNHFYAFSLLTFFGILTYQNTSKSVLVIYYLIFISIFLELIHLIIPIRAFQLEDLFGNLIGVILVYIINIFFKK